MKNNNFNIGDVVNVKENGKISTGVISGVVYTSKGVYYKIRNNKNLYLGKYMTKII